MEGNEDKKKKELPKGCAIAAIILLIIGSWGVPSFIRGDGFFTGIESNFAVLPIMIVIAIVIIAFISHSNN